MDKSKPTTNIRVYTFSERETLSAEAGAQARENFGRVGPISPPFETTTCSRFSAGLPHQVVHLLVHCVQRSVTRQACLQCPTCLFDTIFNFLCRVVLLNAAFLQAFPFFFEIFWNTISFHGLYAIIQIPYSTPAP